MVDISQISNDWEAKAVRQAGYVPHAKAGVIILADISGYTELLTAVADRRTAKVARYITARLFEATTDPFIVNEIEGDALFVYAIAEDDTGDLATATLIQLEAYADAFYHGMVELKHSNLIKHEELRALINRLSMKFVVHKGTWQFDQVGPHVKLIGADVILAHRLLKNKVDSDSYFLFTAPFFQVAGGSDQLGLVIHEEEVKHFGTVEVGVRIFDYESQHQSRHGSAHAHLTRSNIVIE